MSSMALLAAVYVAFQVNAFWGLWWTGHKARQEAQLAGKNADLSSRAMTTAIVLAFSAITTVCYGLAASFQGMAPAEMSWVYQALFAIDVTSDAALAMLAAQVIYDK